MSLSSRTRAEMAVSHGILHRKSPDQIIDMLFDDGLLTSDPQIIRTVEELEALDPDTPLVLGTGLFTVAAGARVFVNAQAFLPAATVGDSAEVRAAREALGEA